MKCRTETQDEQPSSRAAERALPPLPSFETFVKSGIWTRRTIAPPCSTPVCGKPQTARRVNPLRRGTRSVALAANASPILTRAGEPSWSNYSINSLK